MKMSYLLLILLSLFSQLSFKSITIKENKPLSITNIDLINTNIKTKILPGNVLYIIPEDDLSTFEIFSSNQQLNRKSKKFIIFDKTTKEEEVEFSIHFDKQTLNLFNIELIMYSQLTSTNEEINTFNSSDDFRIDFELNKLIKYEGITKKYVFCNVGLNNVILDFDEKSVNIEDIKIGVGFFYNPKALRNLDNYKNSIKSTYFVNRIGNSSSFYIDNRSYGNSIEDGFYIWIELSFINASETTINVRSIFNSNSVEPIKENISSDIPYIRLFTNKNDSNDFGLKSNLLFNPLNSKEDFEIHLSYDIPIFFKKDNKSLKNYYIIKAGYPETLNVNLNDYLNTGRVFVSVFLKSDTSKTSQLTEVEFQLNKYDFEVSSINFSSSHILNTFSTGMNSIIYAYKIQQNATYSYFNYSKNSDNSELKVSSETTVINNSLDNDYPLESNKIVTISRVKDSLDYIKPIYKDNNETLNSNQLFISILEENPTETFEYIKNTLFSLKLKANQLVSFRTADSLLSNIQLLIISNDKITIHYDKNYNTKREIINLIKINSDSKLNSINLSNFQMIATQDTVVMFILKEANEEVVSSEEFKSISIDESSFNKHIIFPLKEFNNNEEVLKNIIIQANQDQFTIDYQIIEDLREEEESIFNYYSFEKVNTSKLAFSSISLLSKFTSKSLFSLKINYNSDSSTKTEPSLLIKLSNINSSNETLADFSHSNYYRINDSIENNYNFLFKDTNCNCLEVIEKEDRGIKYITTPIYKSITKLSNEKTKFLICPIGSKGIHYENKKIDNIENEKQTFKNFIVNNKIAYISLKSKFIKDDSKYFVISEIESPTANLKYIKDLIETNKEAQFEVKLDLLNNFQLKTKFIFQENKNTCISVFAFNMSLDLWWSYSPVCFNDNTESSSRTFTAFVIIIITIFSIIFLIGVYYLIRSYLNTKKESNETIEMLK